MKEHPLTTKISLAIFCITAIAIVAMLKEIDGYLVGLAFTLIAGLAGYSIARIVNKK